MSVALLNRILAAGFEGKRPSPITSQQFVLAVLGWAKNDDRKSPDYGKCCPSRETLVTAIRSKNKDVSTVKTALRWLQDHRYIAEIKDKKQFGGQEYASRYWRIIEPEDPEAALPVILPEERKVAEGEISTPEGGILPAGGWNPPREGVKSAPQGGENFTPIETNTKSKENNNSGVVDNFIEECVKALCPMGTEGPDAEGIRSRYRKLLAAVKTDEQLNRCRGALKIFAAKYLLSANVRDKVSYFQNMLKEVIGPDGAAKLASYGQGAASQVGGNTPVLSATEERREFSHPVEELLDLFERDVKPPPELWTAHDINELGDLIARKVRLEHDENFEEINDLFYFNNHNEHKSIPVKDRIKKVKEGIEALPLPVPIEKAINPD